jgi:hypothetical protein
MPGRGVGGVSEVGEETMSANLSEEKVKQFVREEVRRIIDAGLMYTTTANQPEPQPAKPVETVKFSVDRVVWSEPIPREGKEPFQKAIPQANTGNADYAALAQWLTTKPDNKAFLGDIFLKKFEDGSIGKFPSHKKAK